jgi:hypothetical protein
VPVDGSGRIALYTSAGTDLVLDVAGWYTDETAPDDGHGLFVAVDPGRLLDTRTDLGVLPAPGSTLPLSVVGRRGLPPAGIGSVVTHVTVTQSQQPGYLTASPGGLDRPLAANLNVTGPGQTIANLTVTKLGPKELSYYLHCGGHLVVDVAGWFTA